MIRQVLGHTARLGASALIVTLLTGWAWFDAVGQHRATGVLARSVTQSDLSHSGLNTDRPARATPTPEAKLSSVGGGAPTDDDGLLRRNPAERAHAKPKDRPEMRTWSADELATFLAFTAQDRELALYHVAAATGMRRGELLGLRWRDVDLDGVRLSVRQQYTRQGKSLGFGPPKSAKSIRTIDLDGETVDLLREQRERQLFERRAWGKAYRVDLDLVFCRPGGAPEDPNVVGRRFGRRIRDLARLPAIGLHGLRHTHATLLLEEGVDVKTVSERLGHDSVQTTLELYGHVTPKMRANAAARFGSLLSSARVAPAATMTAEG